ncbi:hypothetical protein [Streptomyces sp. H51]|nr:hypothetical protein [Streptomyces sp. H51]
MSGHLRTPRPTGIGITGIGITGITGITGFPRSRSRRAGALGTLM